MKATVVINNYNYERFLGAAIESALNQTVDGVQVIVVDDGSTDGSLAIARSFGERVTVIEQENTGQGAAYNAGWAIATGRIVCFLDSDDVLYPNAIAIALEQLVDGVSKVQGYLDLVNGEGVALGKRIPFNSISDREIADVAMRFYFYNSPPGSGNFYRKDFLDLVMPMESTRWRIAADAYLICRAPFHGTVKSVNQTLGGYRIHGGGASAIAPRGGESGVVLAYARKEYAKEQLRRGSVHRYYRKIFHSHRRLNDTPSLIKLRIILFRMRKRKLYRMIFWLQIFKRGLYVFRYWEPYSAKKKLLFAGWVVLASVLPLRIFVKLAMKTVYPYNRGY